jgi:vitamin B12 transporter
MVSYVLNDKVKFNANYTFTELERQSRILNPKHKVNAAVDVQATARFAFNVAYQFVSDRYLEYTTYPAPTYDPVLNTTILKDYKQHQCALRIDENIKYFAAVDNVFRQRFCRK